MLLISLSLSRARGVTTMSKGEVEEAGRRIEEVRRELLLLEEEEGSVNPPPSTSRIHQMIRDLAAGT